MCSSDLLIISVVGLVLVQCSFSSILALGTSIMFLIVTSLIKIYKDDGKKDLFIDPHLGIIMGHPRVFLGNPPCACEILSTKEKNQKNVNIVQIGMGKGSPLANPCPSLVSTSAKSQDQCVAL